MKITIVAGARPNFIKIAPIIHAIAKANATIENIKKRLVFRIVHTGQHYDSNMSDMFFNDLNIPSPDVNLGCGGGTQAEQAGSIMVAFEKDLMANPVDLVMVVGDVTSTMACSIVAKKLKTKVAHVEAGIRSWDLTMPEEINRMVTDCLADYFFTTTELANQNLRDAGVLDGKIFFVGNVMIDTLLANRHRFQKPANWDEIGLRKGNYFVLTLHRPNNVDSEDHFHLLITAIIEASRGLPIIFPVHPRTAKLVEAILNKNTQISSQNSELITDNLYLTPPLSYLEFNYLVENTKAVITDSGGITEETTVLGIPCITLRDNTERPETVEIGTNEIIGTDPSKIKPAFNKLFDGRWKKGSIPLKWDGKASERIISTLLTI